MAATNNIKGPQSKVQEPQGQGLSTLLLAIKSTRNIQSFKEVLMNFFFMWHLHTKPFHTQYIISSSSDISVICSITDIIWDFIPLFTAANYFNMTVSNKKALATLDTVHKWT